MIRILIVDDQNLVQQGIKSLLDRDLDFKVIGTVKDGRHAVQQIAQIHPDIVLLDIEMPGMDGITTTKYINRVSPKTKVIILSSHEDKKYVTRALMAGAKGYLLKTSLMTDLKQAISAVQNGYSQIDSRLLAKVFDPQNVRVKKVRPDLEESKVHSDSSDIEETKIHSPTSDTEEVKVNIDNSPEQQSQTTVNSWQTDSEALSLISQQNEEYPSETAQSDNAIQSANSDSEAVLSEVKEELPAQNAFTQDVSDRVILKQTNINKNFNQENNTQTSLPYVASHTVLAPPRKKLLVKSKKLNSFKMSIKRKTLSSVAYGKKLSNKLKRAIRESDMERTKSQLQQYKAKLLLLVRQKKKQPLLWTISLVILGIAIGVVLGG